MENGSNRKYKYWDKVEFKFREEETGEIVHGEGELQAPRASAKGIDSKIDFEVVDFKIYKMKDGEKVYLEKSPYLVLHIYEKEIVRLLKDNNNEE